MTLETAYIIGKVGDVSDNDYYEYVCRKFAIRAASLKVMGYIPINPMELVPRASNWHDAMAICIPVLMSSQNISPLPDTWVSKGGLIEFKLARSMKKPIVIPQHETELQYYESTI
jgi:hypothetical protein